MIAKMKEGREVLREKKRRLKRVAGKMKLMILAAGILAGAYGGKMSKVSAASGTASEVVSLAASQVGYYEKASNAYLDDFTANRGSNNYNKYARDVGVSNGQPWCATFVWWCMANAGVPYANYPSRTTVTRDWFIQRGQYHERGTYTPKPGDYVVFGNAAHCGIVESVSGGYVTTIEGNSSDQVKRNKYLLTNTYISGYGTINYNVANRLPIGYYDEAARGKDKIYVRGWAFDPDTIGTNIEVHIYVGGPAGVGQKYVVKADKYRPDVDKVHGCGAYHGFETTLSISGSDLKNVYVYAIDANNKDLHTDLGGKETAVDLGDNFTALILRSDINKPIRNTGSNIELWDEKTSKDFYWLFKRQSDGSYIIHSLYDNKVIDVYGFGTANGTNIFPCEKNGGDNQKWYIYRFGNGYRFVPKYACDFSMDVTGAGTANGTNIQAHVSNTSSAQKFTIKVANYSEPKPTTATTEAPVVKTTEKTTEAPVVKTTEKTTEAPAVKTTEKTTEAPAVKTTEKTTEAPVVKPTEQPSEKPTVPSTDITKDNTENASDDNLKEDDYKDFDMEDEDDEEDELPQPKAKGTAFMVLSSNCKVIVTSSSRTNPTVAYVKPIYGNLKSIKIPDTVSKDGVVYKVTEIEDLAFKGNKKIKEVTIGKNITSIGTKTFKDCKNLNKITIKGTKLTSIGKSAFKGTAKKKTIKAPNAKAEVYKKMISQASK